jgi:hypothetical protein
MARVPCCVRLKQESSDADEFRIGNRCFEEGRAEPAGRDVLDRGATSRHPQSAVEIIFTALLG